MSANYQQLLTELQSIAAFAKRFGAKNEGRWVMSWVTEETEGYRIAEFKQCLQ